MAKSLRRKSGTELVERHDAAKQRSTQPTQTTQPEREEKSIWSGLPSSSREQEKSIWSGLPSSGSTRQSQAQTPAPVNPSYQNYLNEYLKANERAVLSQSVPGMAERYQQAGERLQDMASNPTRQAYGARSHINPQGILDVKYNDSRRFARTMGALRDVGVTPEEYQAIIGITPKSTQAERIEKTRNLVQADPQLMQTAIHQARLEGYDGGALDQSTLDYVNRIMGATKRRNAVERQEGVDARQKAADTQVPAWAQEAYRQGMTGEDSPLRRNVGLQYISKDGREDGTSPRREYARQMQDVSQIRETGVFDSTYIDQGQSGQAQGHWNPELLSTQGLHDYRDQLQERKDAISDYPDRLAKVQDEYENRSILENITDQKALNDLWAEIANQYGVNPDRERAGDSVRDAQAMADDLDREIKTLDTEIKYRDAHADKPTDFDVESSYRGDKVRQGNGITDEIYRYLGDPDYQEYIIDLGLRDGTYDGVMGSAMAKMNELEMYQVLTESERQQFNYLYNHNSAQEAQAYLDSLKPRINARIAAADNQMYQEMATGNPVAAVALYLGNRLVRPVAGVAGAIGMGLAALGNKEAQDPNSNFYSMTGNIEAMDQAQAQAAGKALSVNVPYFNKPMGEMLFGAVTSAVDSAMSAKAGLALGGGNAKIAENAALLIMGTEAGTSEFRQAMLDGESGTESLIKGLVGAATEIITERLGINEYLEPNLTRGLVTRILAQSGIEGLEEIEGAVINGVYDELSGRTTREAAHMANFYQDENGKRPTMSEARGQVHQRQLREGLEAGVEGAVSGGMMVSTQGIGQTYQANRAGAHIKANQSSLDLMSKIYEGMQATDKADFAKMMGVRDSDGTTDLTEQMAQMGNTKLGRMSMEMLTRINESVENARKAMLPGLQERLRKAGAKGTRKQAELIMDVVDNGFAITEQAGAEMARDGSFAETLRLIASQTSDTSLSPVRGLTSDLQEYAAKMQQARDLAEAMADKGTPVVKDSVDNRSMMSALDAVADDSRPNKGSKRVTYHTTDGDTRSGKVVGITVGGTAESTEGEAGTEAGKTVQASPRKPGKARATVKPGAEAEGNRKAGEPVTENAPGGSAESQREAYIRQVAGIGKDEPITAANTLGLKAEGETAQPEVTEGSKTASPVKEGISGNAESMAPGGKNAEAGKSAGNQARSESGTSAEGNALQPEAREGSKTPAPVTEGTAGSAEASVKPTTETEGGKKAGDGIWTEIATEAEGNAIQQESREGQKTATEAEETQGTAEAAIQGGETAEAGKGTGEEAQESTAGSASGENATKAQEQGKATPVAEEAPEEGKAESAPEVYLAIEDEHGKIEHVSVDDIDTIEDDLVAAAVKMVEEDSTLYTPEELSTMINLYEGGDAAGYIDSFNQAYTAGYYGQTLAPHSTPYLRMDTANLVLRMGQDAAGRTEQVRLSTLMPKKGMTGELIMDSSVHQDALDTNQRSAIDVLGRIIKALGVNIRLYESQADESGRYTSENGKYDQSTNTISIDVHSGRNYTPEGYERVNAERKAQGKPSLTIPQYALLKTAAHELTHYIEHGSGEGYASLRRMVVDQLSQAGYDFDTLVGDKLNAYRAAGYRLTRGGAVAEVIADGMEMMLEDPDTLAKLAKRAPGLFERMKAKLEEIAGKIRQAFFGVEATSREAKALLQKDADGILRYTEELRKAWVDALLQSAQTEDILKDASADALGADEVEAIETMRAQTEELDNAQGAELERMHPGASALSIRQLARALDMDMRMTPMAQIPYELLGKDGKPVTEITGDMVMNTPAGTLIKSALQYGTINQEQADKLAGFYAKLGTMAIKYMDPAMVWELEGSELFSGVKANSDKQYTQTVDFGTVCAKTQAVIDTISDTMLRLGRGLTRSEVLEAYRATYASGQSVPCPVCYVFSRWMGVPSLLDSMRKAQDTYGEMTAEELTAYIDDMERRYKDIGKAKTDVTKKLQKYEAEIQERQKKAGEGQKIDTKDLDPIMKKLDEKLDELTAYNFVTQVICKRVRSGRDIKLYRDKNGMVQRDPRYKPVPKEILLDLRRGADFARYYEKAWLFRSTRGAGLGKAILPYSGHTLGDFIHPIDRWSEKQNHYYAGRIGKGKQSIGYAYNRMRRQNLIGGFRLQSTSDYRPEWGLDYMMTFLEMQMCGAKAQMYTKVLEAVDLFATSGAMVNLSIMPLGSGVRTVNGRDELVFSKVNGIDFDGAYQKTLEYDNVQMILVGINDKHIRMAMADDRITFIIPWHSSGNSKDVLKSLIEGMGEKMGDATNYETTQNDKFREDRTEEQAHLWDLRMNILRGAYLQKGKLTVPEAEMQEIRNDPYLNDLFRRFYEDESETDTYHVSLGKDQAEKIFPYEYWDKTSTIHNADVNGIRFVEYCRHFGITPRFEQFSKDPGYWKLLIDRRMYGLDGQYYDPQVIDVTKFRAEAIPTKVGQAKYGDPVKRAMAVDKTLELIDELKARNGYNFQGYVLEDEGDDDAGQASIRMDNPHRLEDPETYFKNVTDIKQAGWITPRNHLIARDSQIDEIYGIDDPEEAAYAMMQAGGIQIQGHDLRLAVTPEDDTQAIMVNHAMSELGPGKIQIMGPDGVINTIPYQPGDDIRTLLSDTSRVVPGDPGSILEDDAETDDWMEDSDFSEPDIDMTDEQLSIRDAMDDGTAVWSWLYQMGPADLKTTEQNMAHQRFKSAVDGMQDSEERLEKLRREAETATDPAERAMAEGKIRTEQAMLESYRAKAQKALENPVLHQLEEEAREAIRDFEFWRDPAELERQIGSTQERLGSVNAQIEQIWQRIDKNRKKSGVKALDQAGDRLRQADAESAKATSPEAARKQQQASQEFDTVLRSTKSASQKAPKTSGATKQQMRDYDTIQLLRAERDSLMEKLDKAEKQLRDQEKLHSSEMSETKRKLYEKLRKVREEYRQKDYLRRTLENLRKDMTKYKRMAQRDIAYLDGLLRRESDKRNIPEIAKPAVEELLKRVTSLDSAGNGVAFDRDTAKTLYDLYSHMLDEVDESEKEFTDIILEKLDNLVKLYDSMRFQKGMLNEEYYKARAEAYKSIAEITHFFRTYVKNAQNIFIGEQRRDVFAANTQVLDDMPAEDKKVYTGPGAQGVQVAKESILYNNMTPVYFFRKLRNRGLSALWDALHEGENTYGLEMRKAREKIADIQRQYHYWDWADLNGDVLEMRTGQGRTIRLTREQAMSLYASHKRETMNGMDSHHLDQGGFVYKEDFDDGKLMRAPNIGRFTGNKLDQRDIMAIIAWLTPEQRSYADAMVGLLSTDMARLGNATSLKLHGIKKYTEKYYYPFRSFQGNLNQRSDAGAAGKGGQDNRQKNRGFTKALLRNAASALLLEDLSKTVASHISEMITYSALAVPIENFNKVLNVKNYTQDDSIITTRSMLEMKYGKEASDYIARLLEVLNGGIRSDAVESIFGKMVSLFKKGGVTGSLSVAMQQPLSYIRAAALINPKYLISTPPDFSGKAYQEAMQYAGTAVIKDIGGFDVGVGKSKSVWLLDNQEKDTQGKAKEAVDVSKFDQFRSRWNDITGFLPEKMDAVTWGQLWKAVKKEQEAQYPDMDPTSDEFLELCGKRFNDVMILTQVYDSPLSKSLGMQSKSVYMKMLTAFMNEPTLTINLLYDSIIHTKDKEMKDRIAPHTAIALTMLSAVAQAAVKGLFSAGRRRDPDKDQTLLEKILSGFASNLLQELNPLNLLPGIKDVVDVMSGDTLERTDLSILSEIVTAFENFGKGKITDAYAFVEQVAGSVAKLVGMPLKNVMRDVRAMANIFDGVTGIDMSWFPGVGNAKRPSNMGNVGLTMQEQLNPFYGGTDKASYASRLYEAIRSGDETQAEQYRAYMADAKKMTDSSMDYYLKQQLLADYQGGRMSRDEAAEMGVRMGIFYNVKAAWNYLAKADDALAHEGDDAYTASIYGSLMEAVRSGNAAKVQQEAQELIAHGTSESTVQSKIKSSIAGWYTAGDITAQEAERLLTTLTDVKDEEDLYWWFDKQDHLQAIDTQEVDPYDYNPDTASYSKYGDLMDRVSAGDTRGMVSEMDRLTDHGEKEDSIKSRTIGYIGTAWMEGTIDKATATRLYKEIQPEATDNDTYWFFDNYEHKKAHSSDKTYTYSRYTDLLDAMTGGGDWRSEWQRVIDHTDKGTSKSVQKAAQYNVGQRITTVYKPQLVQLVKDGRMAEAADLQALILDLYANVGYNRGERLKAVKKWYKDYID